MLLSPIHPHICTNTHAHTRTRKCMHTQEKMQLLPPFDSFSLLFANAHVLELPQECCARRSTHTQHTHTWLYVHFNVFIVCGGHHILCLLQLFVSATVANSLVYICAYVHSYVCMSVIVLQRFSGQCVKGTFQLHISQRSLQGSTQYGAVATDPCQRFVRKLSVCVCGCMHCFIYNVYMSEIPSGLGVCV